MVGTREVFADFPILASTWAVSTAIPRLPIIAGIAVNAVADRKSAKSAIIGKCSFAVNPAHTEAKIAIFGNTSRVPQCRELPL
jgi:hypothetical protein